MAEYKAHRLKKSREYFLAHPELQRENSWRKSGARNADGSLFKWHDYKVMLAQQDSKCAICHSDNPGGKRDWHVDHDHETGMVRWILCGNCNRGLGYFKDDPSVLRRAAEMLEEK